MRRQTKLKGTNEVIISEKSHNRKYRKEIFTKVGNSMYNSRSSDYLQDHVQIISSKSGKSSTSDISSKSKKKGAG